VFNICGWLSIELVLCYLSVISPHI
jgi:hypothetical protein